MTDPALDRAYRRAIYRVHAPDGAMDLSIGVPSAALGALLVRRGVDAAAFLTACNPGSRQRDDAANQAAQAALVRALARLGLTVLPGTAVDPDGLWPDENSVLALGITRAAAIGLARRFGQNALVWIGADATPELVWAQAGAG